jgi:hypothetical protein
MNPEDAAGALGAIGGLLAGGIVVFLLIFLVMAILPIIAYWKIFAKTGNSGAIALLMIIPLVNLIVLYWMALGDWPALRQAGASPGGYPPPAPYPPQPGYQPQGYPPPPPPSQFQPDMSKFQTPQSHFQPPAPPQQYTPPSAYPPPPPQVAPPAAASVFCGNCGSKLPAGSQFCTGCGGRVG